MLSARQLSFGPDGRRGRGCRRTPDASAGLADLREWWSPTSRMPAVACEVLDHDAVEIYPLASRVDAFRAELGALTTVPKGGNPSTLRSTVHHCVVHGVCQPAAKPTMFWRRDPQKVGTYGDATRFQGALQCRLAPRDLSQIRGKP